MKTRITPKQQALHDMVECKIKVSYVYLEVAILEFTKTEKSVKRDFRKFNGGYRK